MIRILHQIFRTGIVTEPLARGIPAEVSAIGTELKAAIWKRFNRSLTIRQVDAGSCNGCELEIHAMNNAIYNCEKFGIHFTASPRFADLLLVTGPVTHNMEIALKRTYDSTPSPKLVVAVGDCGCNGGIFGETYASLGGIDKVIPVDLVIPGCPPTPTDLLLGLLQLMDKMGGKPLRQ
ncbi:MAG: NADH-quinone oxidoreductase subunit B family protein [Dissulfurispiraceae bacterium]|jgi:Ni,Fe-hydrogenase III small subunit